MDETFKPTYIRIFRRDDKVLMRVIIGTKNYDFDLGSEQIPLLLLQYDLADAILWLAQHAK